MSIAADGDPCGGRSGAVASFGPYSTPQKENSVSQSGPPLGRVAAVLGRSPGGSPNRNLEEGREGNELQIELSASRICRSTGAKTNVAVTHIPNESTHRLGASIALPSSLPFAFIRTNLCKLTFPVTRGASTQSAPAKSTNLVYRGSIFVAPSPAARTALCAMCTEKGGERRGRQGP